MRSTGLLVYVHIVHNTLVHICHRLRVEHKVLLLLLLPAIYERISLLQINKKLDSRIYYAYTTRANIQYSIYWNDLYLFPNMSIAVRTHRRNGIASETTIKRRGKIIEFPVRRENVKGKLISVLNKSSPIQSYVLYSCPFSGENSHLPIFQSPNRLLLPCFMYKCISIRSGLHCTVAVRVTGEGVSWKEKKKKILRKQHATKRQIYYYFSRSPSSVCESASLLIWIMSFCTVSVLVAQRICIVENWSIKTYTPCHHVGRGQFRLLIRKSKFRVERSKF